MSPDRPCGLRQRPDLPRVNGPVHAPVVNAYHLVSALISGHRVATDLVVAYGNLWGEDRSNSNV